MNTLPEIPADGTAALPVRLLRCGEPCPRCGEGQLDYNGMLDLECPRCGYTQSSGGGCT